MLNKSNYLSIIFNNVNKTFTNRLNTVSSHIFFVKTPKLFNMSQNDETKPTSEDIQTAKKTRLEIKEERKANLKARRRAKKETKSVGFSNDILNQTSYYFENGLRKVYPYFFGWNTTAKERWFGRTLVDIYKNEFTRAIINQSIEKLIETGKIRVNGQIKPLNYLIKNGDRISHTKHRHEIPVLDDEIKIIHEDDDFLVVDKPCSIPMHPCGRYLVEFI